MRSSSFFLRSSSLRARFPPTCVSVAAEATVSVTDARKRSAAATDASQHPPHMWTLQLHKKFAAANSKPRPAGAASKIIDPSFRGNVGDVFVDFSNHVVHCGAGAGSLANVHHAVTVGVRAARQKEVRGLSIRTPMFSVTWPREPSGLDIVLSTTTVGSPRATTMVSKRAKRSAAVPAAVVARAVATAAVTAPYTYRRMKTSDESTQKAVQQKKKSAVKPAAVAPAATRLLAVSLLGDKSNSRAVDLAQRQGLVIGAAVNECRTLGNLRPDEGTPAYYARYIARRAATKLPNVLHVRHVLRGRQLADAGLALMHAVGRCAVAEPVLVVTEYVGNRSSSEATALVGKGLTFDCGGMNVKPYGSMETMHQDMMGAAAVMTTMEAAATLRLPVNLIGVTAFAENAIGPNAYLPSTILRSLSGKTVEVLNTDAEGRLVLADALTFVQRKATRLRKRPTRIIDLATLTGAILVSLGRERAGLFANDRRLAQRLMAAGRSANEPLWPMPVGEEHSQLMRGGIADLINCAEGREGGSCTAAAFLQNFIENDTPWAHLDIAGPAIGKDKARGLQPAGAPGFGVKLLMEFLLQPQH